MDRERTTGMETRRSGASGGAAASGADERCVSSGVPGREGVGERASSGMQWPVICAGGFAVRIAARAAYA